MADIGVAEEVADFGDAAARQEDAQGFGMKFQTVGIDGPGFLYGLGYGKSLFGVGDGGLEEVLPGQLAVALVDLGPAFDDAGHGEGVNAGGRHGLDALLREEGRGEGFGGGAGGIQTDELTGAGFAVHDEEVAAEAGLHGFDDGEDCVGGDGGIDGRTSLGQYLRSGRGCQRLAGGGDALLGDHHGAAVVATLREHWNYRSEDQAGGPQNFHDGGYSSIPG